MTVATARGVFRDLSKEYEKLCYQEHGLTSFEEAIPEYTKRFRAFLNKLAGIIGEKKYIAGEITYVDFEVCEFLQHLGLFLPDLTAEFPTLVQYQKRLWALP